MNERIDTSIVFTPSERVTSVLFDFLSEEGVEQVIDAKTPLNFYSKNEYTREDKNTPDMALNRFRHSIEGTQLSLFPHVIGDYWVDRRKDNILQNGLDIEVAVDSSEDEDILRQAQLLGFANRSKLIIARLAIPADLLAYDESHTRSIDRLRTFVTFPPLPEDNLVSISFVDTLLTD